MKKKIASISLSVCLIFAGAITARAGGALESFDITAGAPSPIPGHIAARVIGIKWDARCIPVQYKMNNTLDPIPNPLGTAFLSLADATTAMQASLDVWNEIPTSFIDMQIVGTVSNAGLRGFDFINELTFRTAAGFGAIASSPSVNLIADSVFSDGDDIDGDGDSDVSGSISVCTDVDNDGDNEFPAGFYKAGTILDNDVQYNTKVSNGLRFTVNPADADTVTRSVDLIGVAVHEFGHSHGLSHTLNNQSNAGDGNGATMFPFIDTGDPDAELAQRSLDIDDIAFSSFFYPEGTAASGPAALQPGDVAFDKVFGLIRGSLHHGILNQPIAGGSLFAVDRNTDTVGPSAFSGTTQLSFNPVTGGLSLVNPAFNILDGNYVIPVPKGNYSVGVEPVDGLPVATTSISFTTQIGGFFGQQNFLEEFYNNNKEGILEREPGDAKNVPVNPGLTKAGINITTNRIVTIANFDNRNFVGFTGSPSGRIYAVAIPAAQIDAVFSSISVSNPGHDVLVQAGLFNTFVSDASVPVIFAEAILTTGVINPDTTATVDLTNPIDRVSGFLAQDNDFAPFYFKNPHVIGKIVRDGIASGEIQNLFLILRLPPSPFPGVSGIAPLIGLDGTAPFFGLSYLSDDGGATFTRVTTFNFMFSLVISEPAN